MAKLNRGLRARLIWRDLKATTEDLGALLSGATAADDGEDFRRKIRVSTFSAFCLARAVFHVLHKVDGPKFCLEDEVAQLYLKLKADERSWFFIDWIEEPRNRLIKEYRFFETGTDLEWPIIVRIGSNDNPVKLTVSAPVNDNAELAGFFESIVEIIDIELHLLESAAHLNAASRDV